MTTLLAVLFTAIIVGALTAFFARRSTEQAITRAIAGREGEHPVNEHRRQLAASHEALQLAHDRAEKLASSLEALTSGVIITDQSGKVLARNELSRQASLRSHEQTLVDATVTELMAAATSGNDVDRELEIFGPPPRILFVNAVPITQDGEVRGALAVIDDVTDLHRVAKTRRDFVANLSHELRTPVGAMSLLAEMLLDEQDPETRSRLTGRVLAETTRLEQTIADLLELSRIEAETERFDDVVMLQHLIDDAIARISTQADAAGVAVGSVLPSDPISLLGNLDQLTSCMVNLLENAVKYSESGDSVSVRARVDSDEIFITVQDTGKGIPARDLDRIFERFYRVDRSRDAATGGTGIGLSIVRHVVLNHGGEVSVDSFEGEGSTFSITLPLVAPAATDLSSMPTTEVS